LGTLARRRQTAGDEQFVEPHFHRARLARASRRNFAPESVHSGTNIGHIPLSEYGTRLFHTVMHTGVENCYRPRPSKGIRHSRSCLR
jgi:hypothetical protein